MNNYNCIPLSDRDIVETIIDKNKALKTLSKKDYITFIRIYDSFTEESKLSPLSKDAYLKRAFSVAYSFEIDGIPFKSICREGSGEIMDYYETHIGLFEEDLLDIIKCMVDLVEDLVRTREKNFIEACGYSWAFMYYSLELITHALGDGCRSNIIRTLLNSASKTYYRHILIKLKPDDSEMQTMTAIKDMMKKDIEAAVVGYETVQQCFDEIIEIFIKMVGIPSSDVMREYLRSHQHYWLQIALKYQ